jgi:hypothetical protein
VKRVICVVAVGATLAGCSSSGGGSGTPSVAASSPSVEPSPSASPRGRYEDAEYRYENTITAERFGGDDAIRISRKSVWKPNARTLSGIYVVVIHIGDLVVVPHIYEGYDGVDNPAYVDRIVAAALDRAS